MLEAKEWKEIWKRRSSNHCSEYARCRSVVLRVVRLTARPQTIAAATGLFVRTGRLSGEVHQRGDAPEHKVVQQSVFFGNHRPRCQSKSRANASASVSDARESPNDSVYRARRW